MARVIREEERRVAERHPRFYRYLMSLGSTDYARSAALGLQRMVVAAYRRGGALPRPALVMEGENVAAEVRARRAALVRELAEDLAAAHPQAA